MIVLGDISGIQGYVLDVAEEGGGQARRLRARSFMVQLLAESAVLRVLRALGWGPEAVLLCGAGKFTLRGLCAGRGEGLLAVEQQAINDWLREETRGELRLTLAWADAPVSERAEYQLAQQEMQRNKTQPWAPLTEKSWTAARLILDPLDTPCSLCRHAPATKEESDPDGVLRLVCRACTWNRVLGQKLPHARWLVMRDAAAAVDLAMLGLGIDVITNDFAAIGPGCPRLGRSHKNEAGWPERPTPPPARREPFLELRNGQLLGPAFLAARGRRRPESILSRPPKRTSGRSAGIAC